MRILVLAALLSGGVSTAALAQDADVGVSSWTGPYVGVHGGYGFDHGRQVTNTGQTANNALALSAGIRPNSFSTSRKGILGGAQIGYNFASDAALIGIEADFSKLDSKDDDTYRSPAQVLTFPAGRRANVRHELDWMGTVRARAGFVMNNTILYGTGGYAYGRVKDRAEFDGDTDAVVNYAGRSKYTPDGWTAGGGIEHKFGGTGMLGGASVRVEYLYYDLGHHTTVATQQNTPPGQYAVNFNTQGSVVRAGINFVF